MDDDEDYDTSKLQEFLQELQEAWSQYRQKLCDMCRNINWNQPRIVEWRGESPMTPPGYPDLVKLRLVKGGSLQEGICSFCSFLSQIIHSQTAISFDSDSKMPIDAEYTQVFRTMTTTTITSGRIPRISTAPIPSLCLFRNSTTDTTINHK